MTTASCVPWLCKCAYPRQLCCVWAHISPQMAWAVWTPGISPSLLHKHTNSLSSSFASLPACWTRAATVQRLFPERSWDLHAEKAAHSTLLHEQVSGFVLVIKPHRRLASEKPKTHETFTPFISRGEMGDDAEADSGVRDHKEDLWTEYVNKEKGR